MKVTIYQKIWQYGIAYFFAVISLFPVLLMLVSSLKSNIEILTTPFSLPASPNFSAYTKLLDQLPFMSYLMNSVFVSIVSVLFILLFGALVSFYIARFNFKWNGFLFFFFLMGMMIPIKLGIVPLFLLMKDLNLLNSQWSLIYVYIAIGLPLSVLILTGFFRTMPKELEEAARIDGATDLRILSHLLLPLMKPALGIVMIINFVQVWNDFFFPLIFIQDEIRKTIPVGMLSLFSEYSADWSVLFAGLTLSSLPMILLFVVASKQFMEGLTAGAVK